MEFEGGLDENGMVMDYYDVKEIVAPIIEELDHSFMVYEKDLPLLEALEKLNSKRVTVGFQTTAENICVYLLERIKNSITDDAISAIRVWVYETESTYAVEEIRL